jgi:hypothetical protein
MGEWWGFLRGLVRGQKGVREKKRATMVLDAFKATQRHGAVVGAGTRSRHEAGAGGQRLVDSGPATVGTSDVWAAPSGAGHGIEYGG